MYRKNYKSVLQNVQKKIKHYITNILCYLFPSDAKYVSTIFLSLHLPVKIYVKATLRSTVTYVGELLYNDLHEIPISNKSVLQNVQKKIKHYITNILCYLFTSVTQNMFPQFF